MPPGVSTDKNIEGNQACIRFGLNRAVFSALLFPEGERRYGLLGQQGSLRRRDWHTVRACYGPQGGYAFCTMAA